MELFEYLKTCQEKIGDITIDEEFIKFRDESKNRFNPNGRDETQCLMNADCLVTEYYLLKNGMAGEPESIRYDFSIGESKIDAKMISSKYFNMPGKSVRWYESSIELNQLTHFAFYQYINPPNRPLQAGDKVQIKLLKIEPAKKVIGNKLKSKTSGYYFVI